MTYIATEKAALALRQCAESLEMNADDDGGGVTLATLRERFDASLRAVLGGRVFDSIEIEDAFPSDADLMNLSEN